MQYSCSLQKTEIKESKLILSYLDALQSLPRILITNTDEEVKIHTQLTELLLR